MSIEYRAQNDGSGFLVIQLSVTGDLNMELGDGGGSSKMWLTKAQAIELKQYLNMVVQ